MDETEITKTLQTELNFYKVKVQVKQKEDQLHVLLTRGDTNDVDYSVLFDIIKGNLAQLKLVEITNFIIYGRLAKAKQPEWQRAGIVEPVQESSELLDVDEHLEQPLEIANDPNEDDGASFLLDERLESLENPDYPQELSPSLDVPEDVSETKVGRSTEVVLPFKPQNPQKLKIDWVPIAVGSAVLIVIGSGWFFWDRSIQERKIADAQAIAAKTFDPKQLNKIEALTDAQQQLKQAIALLEEVPDRPGSPYDQAQSQLAPLKQKLSNVDKKLLTEQSAASSLEAAKKLAKEASALVQTPPVKLETWQAAQSKWQDAVKSLEKIPAGTFVSDDAKKKLVDYRNNYASITGQLQKQRLIDTAAIFWTKRMPTDLQNELKKLKASGLTPVQFANKCTVRVRPTLNANELQNQGFQVNPFAASICNYILSSK